LPRPVGTAFLSALCFISFGFLKLDIQSRAQLAVAALRQTAE
jgi:hypothetical protein